jgi:CMP-2-keto-3-deoxyoctulosonic acid synthetase
VSRPVPLNRHGGDPSANRVLVTHKVARRYTSDEQPHRHVGELGERIAIFEPFATFVASALSDRAQLECLRERLA